MKQPFKNVIPPHPLPPSTLHKCWRGAYICLYDDQVARDLLVVEPLSQDDGAEQRQRDVKGPVGGLGHRRLVVSGRGQAKGLQN